MPNFICEFIESRGLQNIVSNSVMQGTFASLSVQILLSLSIPFFINKVYKYFSNHSSLEYINSGVTISGHTSDIRIPIFSVILTVVLMIYGWIGKIIYSCDLITTNGVGTLFEKALMSLSLFLLCYLFISTIVSIIFTIIEWYKENKILTAVNSTITIIYGIYFVIYIFNLKP